MRLCWEIVGANAFAAVAAADLSAALLRQLRLVFAFKHVEQPGAQHFESLGAVFVLGFFVLACHYDAQILAVFRFVRHPHGRVGGIDALTAGAGRAEHVNPQVCRVDVDIHFLGLRQDGDRDRRGMDTALRFPWPARAVPGGCRFPHFSWL